MAHINGRNDTPLTALTQDNEGGGHRSVYSRPDLKVYGHIAALTQAGTGLGSELMSNGMSSMSPNQRA